MFAEILDWAFKGAILLGSGVLIFVVYIFSYSAYFSLRQAIRIAHIVNRILGPCRPRIHRRISIRTIWILFKREFLGSGYTSYIFQGLEIPSDYRKKIRFKRGY